MTLSHDAAPPRLTLDTKRHTAFWLRHLRLLPRPYTSADTQRMTLAYFALSALDLLGAVEGKLPREEQAHYREWIWAQQVRGGGFLGSPATASSSQGDGGHLAMTYTALLSLAILRDDFKRLDRAALKGLLGSLQQHDGR